MKLILASLIGVVLAAQPQINPFPPISHLVPGTPSSGPGSGTVTSITQGCGEIFSTTPLVATGTISAAGPCLGIGAGTAQAQTATYTPAITSLTNGLWLCWVPSNANSAAAPTFAPDGMTAHTLVKAGGALAANDIITSAQACAVYNTTGTQWELQNAQTGGLATNGSSTDILTSNGTGGFGTALPVPLAVNKGGTGLTSGTSGGVLCYTASGTLASSAALAANALVIGGGAGVCPSGTTAIPNGTTATTQSQNDNSTKPATTAYTDLAISNAIAGVNPAVAVQAATTSASNTSGFTYNNGVSGIGATLTGAVNTALTVDGYTFTALGQRLLVKNDTQSPSGAFNGVYYVTQVQTGILPLILARALDYDTPSDINNTGAIPVVNGTLNATTSWLLTSAVATVGTDPLTYTQFSVKPSNIVQIAGFSVCASVGCVLNETANWTYAVMIAGTITSCGAIATTAPTGSAIIVDVLLNGTSIYGGNPKTTVAVSSTSYAAVSTFASSTVAVGDKLTAKVTQIDSNSIGQFVRVSCSIQ